MVDVQELMEMGDRERRARLATLLEERTLLRRRALVVPSGATILSCELAHGQLSDEAAQIQIALPQDMSELVMVNRPSGEGQQPLLAATGVGLYNIEAVFQADGTFIGYVLYWASTFYPSLPTLLERYHASKDGVSPHDRLKEAVRQLSARLPIYHGAFMASYSGIRRDGDPFLWRTWSSRMGIIEATDYARDWNREHGQRPVLGGLAARVRGQAFDHPERTRHLRWIDAPSDDEIDAMDDHWYQGEDEQDGKVYQIARVAEDTVVAASDSLCHTFACDTAEGRMGLREAGIPLQQVPKTIGLGYDGVVEEARAAVPLVTILGLRDPL